MSILAECPGCHRKQTLRNKKCLSCGEDLDKAKKSKRVRHWIYFRMPDKTQRMEAVGSFEDLDPYSIEDARDANSKRKVQKRENRLLDIKPESKMSFQELTDWYLGLEKVKALRSYKTVVSLLKRFNLEFGTKIVGQVKRIDLENYQVKRKVHGRADATVDQEVADAKSMIQKAFDNDLVGGETLKVFKGVRKLLKANVNARDRIISLKDFHSILDQLPPHVKWIFATAFFTGMRRGEIVNLTWDKVSLPERVIRLEARDTKDKEPREIPICDDLYAVLREIPRAIHDNRVFLNKGRMVRDFRKSLSKACEKSGILYGRKAKGGFTLHDMRHTFNTNMRKSGVDKSVIMKITGHSSDSMFRRYNTVDEEDRTEAVRKFEGFLRNQKSNANQNANQVGYGKV